ncbi:MAG: methionyl-tRNA formyltransferase, partial [Micrococcales bacterium]
VLTREDSLFGRKKVMQQSAVADLADELGIPIIKANRVTPEVIEKIKQTGAQLGVVVAYGCILKPAALEALNRGWVNLHYSLLPEWRGAAPAQRAILNGDQTTGVTLFQLDEGLDTGAIWGQVSVELQPGENSAQLIARLTGIGVSLLDEQLPRIASGIFSPEPQKNVRDVRIASKITRYEAELNFADSAIHLERAVLAFNPEPIAYTTCLGESFRVLDARALGPTDWAALSESTHNPGSLVVDNKRVLVQCGEGTLLELKTVQPAGKRPMPALDWSRGSKVERLG